jgi:hypothetical protein
VENSTITGYEQQDEEKLSTIKAVKKKEVVLIAWNGRQDLNGSKNNF